MKNLVIILTFCFLLLGIYSHSEAKSTCNHLKVKPEIKISTSYGQLSYDFNHNTKQISELAAQYGQHESSFFASGLATLGINRQYEVGTRAYPLDDNKSYCVVPEVIKIFVGFTSPKIYISNELEKKSCTYNLVLLHERTHQRINIATLNYFLPIFEEAAAKIAEDILPKKIFSDKQIKSATKNFTKDFSDKFDKVFDVFKKELAVEQGKLDNRINYSMEDNLCRKFNAKKQQSSRN